MMKRNQKSATMTHRTVPAYESGLEPICLPNGLHTVEILSTTVDWTTSPEGRHCLGVTVLVGKTTDDGREYQGSREFFLNSACAVWALRRYFSLFDYPIIDEGDLPDACFRARYGTLRVRVSTGKDGTSFLEILELIPKQWDQPDREDTSDIWNHRRHWELRNSILIR